MQSPCLLKIDFAWWLHTVPVSSGAPPTPGQHSSTPRHATALQLDTAADSEAFFASAAAGALLCLERGLTVVVETAFALTNNYCGASSSNAAFGGAGSVAVGGRGGHCRRGANVPWWCYTPRLAVYW